MNLAFGYASTSASSGEHVDRRLQVPQGRWAVPLQEFEHPAVERVGLAHIAIHQPRTGNPELERHRRNGRYESSFPSGPGIRVAAVASELYSVFINGNMSFSISQACFGLRDARVGVLGCRLRRRGRRLRLPHSQ